MSLLRLLTAGKCLVGLKNAESRYHLPAERALPKFGEKKNPFRATVFPEKPGAGAGTQEPIQEGSKGAGGTGGNAAAGERNGEQLSTEADPDRNNQKTSSVGFVKNDGGPMKEERKSLDLPARSNSAVRAFLLWTRAKKARTFGHSNGQPMVQAELSLDGVKVVRNDLSESDLEIVRAREAPAGKRADEVRGGVEPEVVPAGPSRVPPAGRLFGAGKQ